MLSPLRWMNLARLQCRETLLGTAAEDWENTLCICPANCQEEKFEKSEKKRGFWALFIKIVELYKIYQITFQERLTVVTNLQEMIGQKKNDFRSRLLGMSRRQIKSFLVQQFFKNAAEVQGE